MTDVAQAYGLGGQPLLVVLVALFAIVLLRSHATYWAGRAVTRGARLGTEKIAGPRWWQRTVHRVQDVTSRPAARRGLDLVRRWGALAVVLAYVTVGVQTVVFAGSGLLRMPYLRFTVASLPGAAAWALIWATVGLGAVYGAVALAAASPWVLAGVAALVALVVALVVLRRRAIARTDEAGGASTVA